MHAADKADAATVPPPIADAALQALLELVALCGGAAGADWSVALASASGRSPWPHACSVGERAAAAVGALALLPAASVSEIEIDRGGSTSKKN